MESPFKWGWHHSLVPKYVTGKITGKGKGLKDSVHDEFTWKGIHNKGGRRRRRRSRRRGGRQCGNYLSDCDSAQVGLSGLPTGTSVSGAGEAGAAPPTAAA